MKLIVLGGDPAPARQDRSPTLKRTRDFEPNGQPVVTVARNDTQTPRFRSMLFDYRQYCENIVEPDDAYDNNLSHTVTFLHFHALDMHHIDLTKLQDDETISFEGTTTVMQVIRSTGDVATIRFPMLENCRDYVVSLPFHRVEELMARMPMVFVEKCIRAINIICDVRPANAPTPRHANWLSMLGKIAAVTFYVKSGAIASSVVDFILGWHLMYVTNLKNLIVVGECKEVFSQLAARCLDEIFTPGMRRTMLTCYYHPGNAPDQRDVMSLVTLHLSEVRVFERSPETFVVSGGYEVGFTENGVCSFAVSGDWTKETERMMEFLKRYDVHTFVVRRSFRACNLRDGSPCRFIELFERNFIRHIRNFVAPIDRTSLDAYQFRNYAAAMAFIFTAFVSRDSCLFRVRDGQIYFVNLDEESEVPIEANGDGLFTIDASFRDVLGRFGVVDVEDLLLTEEESLFSFYIGDEPETMDRHEAMAELFWLEDVYRDQFFQGAQRLNEPGLVRLTGLLLEPASVEPYSQERLCEALVKKIMFAKFQDYQSIMQPHLNASGDHLKDLLRNVECSFAMKHRVMYLEGDERERFLFAPLMWTHLAIEAMGTPYSTSPHVFPRSMLQHSRFPSFRATTRTTSFKMRNYITLDFAADNAEIRKLHNKFMRLYNYDTYATFLAIVIMSSQSVGAAMKRIPDSIPLIVAQNEFKRLQDSLEPAVNVYELPSDVPATARGVRYDMMASTINDLDYKLLIERLHNVLGKTNLRRGLTM